MPIASGTTSSVGIEDSRPCDVLIDELALFVGGRSVDKIQEQARLALRSAVGRFNRMRNWIDRLLLTTVNFVADQREYDLPARFRLPLGRAWLMDSSSLRRIPVRYKPYEVFLRLVDDETGKGQPNIYTVRNKIDGGQFEVWPVPTSTTVINFPSLKFYYYAEIPVCGSTLGVGPPLEEAIMDDARWRIMRRVGDQDVVGGLKQDAYESRVEAEAYDNEKRLNLSIFQEFE